MYTGAALSFGLIRACRGGLVLYCSVLSDAGGENDGSSAIFERSLLLSLLRPVYYGKMKSIPCMMMLWPVRVGVYVHVSPCVHACACACVWSKTSMWLWIMKIVPEVFEIRSCKVSCFCLRVPRPSQCTSMAKGFRVAYESWKFMMTSSNGHIFRVTGPLCGEFTGPGEFPTQRPVTRSFGVFFDLRLNKRLSKQPWGWWFETPTCSLWRHCNVVH